MRCTLLKGRGCPCKRLIFSDVLMVTRGVYDRNRTCYLLHLQIWAYIGFWVLFPILDTRFPFLCEIVSKSDRYRTKIILHLSNVARHLERGRSMRSPELVDPLPAHVPAYLPSHVIQLWRAQNLAHLGQMQVYSICLRVSAWSGISISKVWAINAILMLARVLIFVRSGKFCLSSAIGVSYISVTRLKRLYWSYKIPHAYEFSHALLFFYFTEHFTDFTFAAVSIFLANFSHNFNHLFFHFLISIVRQISVFCSFAWNFSPFQSFSAPDFSICS